MDFVDWRLQRRFLVAGMSEVLLGKLHWLAGYDQSSMKVAAFLAGGRNPLFLARKRETWDSGREM